MFLSTKFALSFISGWCGIIFYLHFSSTLVAVGAGSLVQLPQRACELTILFYEFVDFALLIFDNVHQFICRVAHLLDVLLVCRGCNGHLAKVDGEALFWSICEFISYVGGSLRKPMLAWWSATIACLMRPPFLSSFGNIPTFYLDHPYPPIPSCPLLRTARCLKFHWQRGWSSLWWAIWCCSPFWISLQNDPILRSRLQVHHQGPTGCLSLWTFLPFCGWWG